MKIGIQGVKGSYSDQATHYFFSGEDYDEVKFDDFDSLVEALLNEEVDYAVVPIENSTTGTINRSYDLLRYEEVYAHQEVYLPIRHALIANPGVEEGEIKDVYSHPEALSQCQNYFRTHPNLSSHSFVDTAEAVSYVKDQGDPTKAALASEYAANLYDMNVLETNVQDNKENYTRFILLSTDKPFPKENDKIMLYFEVNDEPGELVKILTIFSLANINLLNLFARPTETFNFTYGFFVELSLESNKEEYQQAMNWIQIKTPYFRFIGAFTPGKTLGQDSEEQ